MPICIICDDSGLRNSSSTSPEFCFCAAGKQARRQWEASVSTKTGSVQAAQPRPASFIDIANLDDVNASVSAMKASLLGSVSTDIEAPVRPAIISLLYQVAHVGHKVSVPEATELYELAKSLEGFLGSLLSSGSTGKR